MRNGLCLALIAVTLECFSTPPVAGNEDAGLDAGELPDAADAPDAAHADAGDASVIDSQSTYTYEGCDGGGFDGCPRESVFTCAMETIRAKYAGCTRDEDCGGATVTTCVTYGACAPIAIADASQAAYLAEAQVEINRYCDHAGCGSAPICAAFSGTFICRDGGCAAGP